MKVIDEVDPTLYDQEPQPAPTQRLDYNAPAEANYAPQTQPRYEQEPQPAPSQRDYAPQTQPRYEQEPQPAPSQRVDYAPAAPSYTPAAPRYGPAARIGDSKVNLTKY